MGLYNLAHGIGETNDLAATMPEKVKELLSKWNAWNASQIKPRWGAAHTDNDGVEPNSRPAKESRTANITGEVKSQRA